MEEKFGIGTTWDQWKKSGKIANIITHITGLIPQEKAWKKIEYSLVFICSATLRNMLFLFWILPHIKPGLGLQKHGDNIPNFNSDLTRRVPWDASWKYSKYRLQYSRHVFCGNMMIEFQIRSPLLPASCYAEDRGKILNFLSTSSCLFAAALFLIFTVSIGGENLWVYSEFSPHFFRCHRLKK